jgi:hypothetical protein
LSQSDCSWEADGTLRGGQLYEGSFAEGQYTGVDADSLQGCRNLVIIAVRLTTHPRPQHTNGREWISVFREVRETCKAGEVEERTVKCFGLVQGILKGGNLDKKYPAGHGDTCL